jgi:hypothetical protein
VDAHRSRQGRLARAALRPALLGFGAYHFALGVWMAAGPRSFYEQLAPYGSFSAHFVRDIATFYLALGAVQIIAAARTSWQRPVLVLTVVQYTLHALNHLIDIGGTHPHWKGVFSFAIIALVTVIFWMLLRATAQRDAER